MRRKSFLKPTPEEARKTISTRTGQLGQVLREIDSFRDAVNSLQVLDSYGCADRWLPLVLEEWDNMVQFFVTFKADVDAFVKEQTDLASAIEGEGFNGVELLDDDVTTFLVELLQRRRSAVVGSPVDAVTVLGDVIQALNDSALHVNDAQAAVEVVWGSVVDEGNHTAEGINTEGGAR